MFSNVCCLSLVLLSLNGIHSRRIPPSHFNASSSSQQSDIYEHFSEPLLRDQRRRLSSQNPNDRLIGGLPGLKKYPYRQWSGYVDVDKGHGHLFYWLFESWKDPSKAPLVVWLNGGPGCSSMDGLFLENGPFKVNGDMSLAVNPHTWASVANVLYIDQPVGTGLSYTKGGSYPKNDGDVNRHLFEFFDGFFQIHSDLIGRELFFTGESHAGHYLPSFAQAVVKRSEKQGSNHPNKHEVINLGGLAIGNGWFDPRHQYDVSDFAHGMGLVSKAQATGLKQKERTCRSKLDSGSYMNTICWDLLDDVVRQSGAPGKSKVLMYDVRQYSKSSASFPPGRDRVEKYLNKKDVRAAIHATECPLQFKECTDPPYNALKHQDGLGVTKDITSLLDKGVNMLFFNGQYDMICNHVGVETSLEALQWKGSKDFAMAMPSVWTVGGETAGYVRSFGSLSLLLVLHSGHMVPLDRPTEALDMITRFISKRTLADSKGGVKPRSSLSDVKQDASLLPPIIEETPLPGDGMVAVSFTQNREAVSVKSSGPSSGAGTGRYVVTSSPGALTAEGASSPIIVKGLTNGVAYTFSVVSQVHEEDSVRVSMPSVGSSAVTPGCGAKLGEDLLKQDSVVSSRSRRKITSSRSFGGSSDKEEVVPFDQMSMLELSFASGSAHVIGCHHGVCALNGDQDKCLCFAGYSGDDCSKTSH